MDIKIAKVTPKRNGVDGLVVTFEKREKATDGLSYNNEYEGRFKMPVPHSLRDKWNELTKHVIKLLCLNAKIPTDSIIFNWIQCNAAGEIMIAVKIQARHNRWYSAVVPVLISDEEYEGYTEMYDIISEVFLMSARYILNSEVASPKQAMLDFADTAEREKKSFSFTKDEINDLSEEDAMAAYADIMEDRGYVFLERPEKSQ